MAYRRRETIESVVIDNIVFKRCTECKELKILNDYYTRAGGQFGKNSICKYCCNDLAKARHKKRFEEDSNYYKDIALRQNYNLTREQYEELIKNGCHACGSYDKLHVDHNHVTKTIRGILCHDCNIALGLLKDDVDRILKLAHYLESKTYALG
jgi:NMD protein affecting ribosome stability and mRNA decay